ncbi:uncharacterized protein FPRN_14826 [Fusarium proliferatum]|nr:uncharacterized protein FPRN_14826 [Fusarium proliferatum]
MTLEECLARQTHQRASRSKDLPPGTSSNYGQPTAYQPVTSSGRGFTQTTGAQPLSNYQPPTGVQQNVIPQAPSWQTPPLQQPSYHRGYTASNPAPSLTTTSRQGNSTDSTSTESSEDEYVGDLGSPSRGSRRLFHEAVGSAAAHSNTDSARRQRSHHRSTSGSVVDQPTLNPSQATRRQTSSRHRRSSSDTTTTAARSGRLPRAGGLVLPNPADRLPQQMVAPQQSQPYRPWTPLPPPSALNAPAYGFPPRNSQSRPYAGYGQSDPSQIRYPTGGAPPTTGTMTAQLQQLSFNQSNEQRASMGSGSGSPMSGTPLRYSQQPYGRRASSPDTRVSPSQNTAPGGCQRHL